MTERLSDADLERLASDPIEIALIDGDSVDCLVREVIALRAQQAPTTGEPAAWGLFHGGNRLLGAYTTRQKAEGWASAEDKDTVVPLYRHPAPATDDPTARVLAVLNDWETEEPEDGWGTLADDIRAALTQPG